MPLFLGNIARKPDATFENSKKNWTYHGCRDQIVRCKDENNAIVRGRRGGIKWKTALDDILSKNQKPNSIPTKNETVKSIGGFMDDHQPHRWLLTHRQILPPKKNSILDPLLSTLNFHLSTVHTFSSTLLFSLYPPPSIPSLSSLFPLLFISFLLSPPRFHPLLRFPSSSKRKNPAKKQTRWLWWCHVARMPCIFWVPHLLNYVILRQAVYMQKLAFRKLPPVNNLNMSSKTLSISGAWNWTSIQYLFSSLSLSCPTLSFQLSVLSSLTPLSPLRPRLSCTLSTPPSPQLPPLYSTYPLLCSLFFQYFWKTNSKCVAFWSVKTNSTTRNLIWSNLLFMCIESCSVARCNFFLNLQEKLLACSVRFCCVLISYRARTFIALQTSSVPQPQQWGKREVQRKKEFERKQWKLKKSTDALEADSRHLPWFDPQKISVLLACNLWQQPPLEM